MGIVYNSGIYTDREYHVLIGLIIIKFCGVTCPNYAGHIEHPFAVAVNVFRYTCVYMWRVSFDTEGSGFVIFIVNSLLQ